MPASPGVDLRRSTASDERPALRTAAARPIVTTAARVALWLLVAAGAVGGIVGLLRPPATAQEPTSADVATVSPEVVGFAELAARRWLARAGSENPDLAIEPPVASAGRGLASTGSAVAIAARELTDSYWAVTVAVDVVEARGGMVESTGVWFVELGIARDRAGRLGLVAQPGLVPAPAAADLGRRPAGPLWRTPATEEPVAVAVAAFADALLTGGGDVSRYLAPGFALRGVDPPPFVEVTLARLAVEKQGADVRARALVEGRTPGGAVAFVAYELRLRERAGRWEVASLSGAPTLKPVDTESPAATTTTRPATPGA
jgi:hypothetical protein